MLTKAVLTVDLTGTLAHSRKNECISTPVRPLCLFLLFPLLVDALKRPRQKEREREKRGAGAVQYI